MTCFQGKHDTQWNRKCVHFPQKLNNNLKDVLTYQSCHYSLWNYPVSLWHIQPRPYGVQPRGSHQRALEKQQNRSNIILKIDHNRTLNDQVLLPVVYSRAQEINLSVSWVTEKSISNHLDNWLTLLSEQTYKTCSGCKFSFSSFCCIV